MKPFLHNHQSMNAHYKHLDLTSSFSNIVWSFSTCPETLKQMQAKAIKTTISFFLLLVINIMKYISCVIYTSDRTKFDIYLRAFVDCSIYIDNRSSRCRYCLNMWTPFQSLPGVVLIYFSQDSFNRSTDFSLW